MGLEPVIAIMWTLAVISMIVVVIRMAITKRKIAFGLAIATLPIAWLPLFVLSGPTIWGAFILELIAALFIGSMGLIHARRWKLAAVLTFPVAALCVTRLIVNIAPTSESLSAYHVFGLICFLGFLMTPAFLTLAAVFFSGAFIEKRYQGA